MDSAATPATPFAAPRHTTRSSASGRIGESVTRPDAVLFDRLSRLECVALDTDYRELSAAMVGAAHEAGYKVLTYTANDPATVRRLVAWKVDGIITDAIDVVRPE